MNISSFFNLFIVIHLCLINMLNYELHGYILFVFDSITNMFTVVLTTIIMTIIFVLIIIGYYFVPFFSFILFFFSKFLMKSIQVYYITKIKYEHFTENPYLVSSKQINYLLLLIESIFLMSCTYCECLHW
ncbi:hypothetical protein KSF78_0003579 [Schistosoma japonicum]|nr:hypothetical protein KSF78_0003579 [Schistosoma japonicum]